MSEGLDRERLRALVSESGRSARAVSMAAGLGATAVKDILSGKSKRPEFETLQAIAAELGVTVADFTTSVEASEKKKADQLKIVPRYLPVRYRVQAGLWYEVEFAEPPVQVSLPVTPDPRYANWPQWLELVEGDSVDLKVPPGHYVHVVDAIEMGYAPRDGDWVVVERRRNQGAERERTIKQIEILQDRAVRLRSRSSNPKWERNPPLLMRDGRAVVVAGVLTDRDDIEVEIVGLVIGSYNPDF